MLLLYFSGRGVQGLPRRLSEKRRAGVFLDRVGISHDLAIAAGADGRDMLPVAALQERMAFENCWINMFLQKKFSFVGLDSGPNPQGQEEGRHSGL